MDKGQGVRYRATEGNLASGGEHTAQDTDVGVPNGPLEAWMSLLTIVTPTNLI